MPGLATIQVEGISELNRAFGRLDKRLQRELQAEMRAIAAVVAERAKQIAEEKGLRRSGRLVESIKPGARRGGAVVRETAVRTTGKGAPYKYPGIYEFGGRAGLGQVGPRAFLKPAVDDTREETVRGVELLLDRLISAEGLGRGGLL
jgi:phage gpG-like protein